jgi:hypothetical protein
MHPQVLERQLEAIAIIELDAKQTGSLAQANFERCAIHGDSRRN